ncbi:DNA-directed RNA polymerase III subunit RPC10 [Neolecta irregularis DAH-3]|uniref:DNA-directed RNA polymerase III subunit RPC10 n=1 Tax=Neolecta irregularis (strain DAH-3) TaxID=1198029 RepID=A0A1U7LMW3_NEOID|nr:DNA-directed RNA polymerase III subunit RPC10 [Neolecta irregularis DAH-3]|eukprot:OLL23994.1 DNA-directed RNA polymerase III subunit RPC10 [Neolecta irregularis DAH-3]
MKKKAVDDVLGGEKAWDNVDRTDAQCPNDSCNNQRAYFFQLQIRSADEPSSTFYKCTECAHQWREN